MKMGADGISLRRPPFFRPSGKLHLDGIDWSYFFFLNFLIIFLKQLL